MEPSNAPPSKSNRLMRWLGPLVVLCILMFNRHQSVRRDHEAKRRYVEMFESEESLVSLREAATKQGIKVDSRLTSTTIPSWATRKKTLLGLGAVEWTVQESTLLWGTKQVVYRIKDGKAIEQLPGN